ncbi:Uncharacterized protein SAPIO_CDS9313 [Scedosporium apiospermum]|uniref:Phytanoyl-CoA dioxygenase n=1 Tax=Pseudallescheria apiosperma TaxID=563466 RepID=A0A084FWJ2_PSEDA|nr:Uncharacterized protein SAPIO_CDS9313 [Scedosporium apiospermum]KEZ39454.1 Uncharacterized protein SAPIO_CDS9313 [Scedosporium apiospermum]
MASNTDSLEDSLRTLREEGFLILNDSQVGDLVSEMEDRGFPFLTSYGLHYCKQHILDNENVRPILEGLLGTCKLGHWIRYNSLPDRIECFRKGGRRAGLRALVVQQWAKGSQAVYYAGSHLHDLPAVPGERSLYETEEEELEKAGCKAIEKIFRDGEL